MKCRDAHEMLNSYFDNKIDPMKDKLLAEHIKSCPECRAEFDFMNRYRSILNTVKPEPAPDNFLSELRNRIESGERENRFLNLLNTFRNGINSFSFPVEAAGVLAVALVVFFLYRPFFSEKIQKQSSEFAVESPREENAPLKQTEKSAKSETPGADLRLSTGSDVLKDKADLPAGGIIAKEESTVYETADDNFSEKSINSYSTQNTDTMKKSRTLESEKKSAFDEEQSLAGKAGDVKGAMSIQKDSPAVSVSSPESIFVKHKASVIKKDLSDSKRLYYRIKVSSDKYSSMIQSLKKDFAIEIKIISKTKTFYEIELFIKKQ